MMEMLPLRLFATVAGVALVAWLYQMERKDGPLPLEKKAVGLALLAILVINPWVH